MVKKKILQVLKIKTDKQKQLSDIDKQTKPLKVGNIWDNSSELTAIIAGSGISIIDTGTGMPAVSLALTAGSTDTITFNGTSEVPTLDLTIINDEDASYTNSSITVDKYGRITAASSGSALVTAVVGTTDQISIQGTDDKPVIGLTTTPVTAGNYTNASITVDDYGRITEATDGVVIDSVTSVTVGDSETIVVSGTADAPILDLSNTSVTPDIYTYTTISVDKYGRITNANNGDSPVRKIVSSDNMIVITEDVDDTTGTKTLTLADELQGLGGNVTSGLITRTDKGDYTGRTINAASNNIVLTNGDGISGNPIIDLSTSPVVDTITINNSPSTNTDGTNKEYVDALVAGLAFKNPCMAATTGPLTANYYNGTNGVGATLTATTQGAVLNIDDYGLKKTNRALVKDQSDKTQNGIYTLTVFGGEESSWVLTRATDYDSAGEIKAGNMVSVSNGTVNADTIWLETSIVNTVGSDNISFAQFSYGPSGFLQKNNNLSDLTDATTALNNLGLQQAVFSDQTTPASKGYVPFSSNYDGTDLVGKYNEAIIYSDDNGLLNIVGGAGGIELRGNTQVVGNLELTTPTYNISLIAAGTLDESYNIIFPSVAPKDNQILLSNSSGFLTWVDNTSAGVTSILSGPTSTITIGGSAEIPTIDMVTLNTDSASFTNASITVDKFGRVSNASSGTAPITALTGGADISITSGTTPTITLNPTSVHAGSYTLSSVTVDANGRITDINSGNVPISSISGTSGEIDVSTGSAPTVSLEVTGVQANTYTNPTITVDAKGRITTATNGTSSSGITSVNSGATNTINVTNPDSTPTLDLIPIANLPIGSFTNATVTIDAYGRVTNASSGTGTSTIASTTLTVTPGTSTDIELTSGIVTANTYTNPSTVIVDTYGRVTSITSGSAPVTSITQGANKTIQITGTTTPSLELATFTAGNITYNYPINMMVDKYGRVAHCDGSYAPVMAVAGTAGQIVVTNGTSVGGTSATVSLPVISGVAGSYTNSAITVDSWGRITTAASGATPISGISSNTLSVNNGNTPSVDLLPINQNPVVIPYPTSITVDTYGRFKTSSSAGVVSSVTLDSNTGTTITSPLSINSTTSGGAISTVITQNTSGVNPQIYYNPSNMTVDKYGRITSAATGTAPLTGLSSSTLLISAGTTPNINLQTASNPGATYNYPSSLTTDNYGRVSAVTPGTVVTSISSGSGISIVNVTNTTTGSSTPTVSLASGVVPANTYATPSSVTVDTYGRVTNVVAGTVVNGITGGTGIAISGTTNNPIISLSSTIAATTNMAVFYYTNSSFVSWLAPSGVNSAKITVIGAGGAGSGTNSTNQVGQSGGSGASLIAFVTGLAGATLSILVGRASFSGGNTAGNSAVTWTDTSSSRIASTLIAPGGVSGNSYVSGVGYYVGAPGATIATASNTANVISTILYAGQWGSGSLNLSTPSCYLLGAGGSTILGGGAPQQTTGNGGGYAATQNTGSGGGAGGGATGGTNGGAGAHGIVIIEW